MKNRLKKLGKISLIAYRWIIISIIIQATLLYYIDKFYLTDNTEAKVVVVETTKTDEKVQEKEIRATIPKDVKDIKVSSDGLYFACNNMGQLDIYSVEENQLKKTVKFEKDVLTFYKWLPDRNIIIYAFRAPDNDGGRVNVVTYDMNSENEHSYPKLYNGLPRKSEIVDLELSPFTNVLYMKIKTSETMAAIYKFNIMDELSFIMNIDMNSIIKKTSYVDNLIYQDEKNKLYQRLGAKYRSTPLPFEGKMVLIGVDVEDKVYAAEFDADDKFNCLYKGDKSLEDISSWTKVEISRPQNFSNLIITKLGDVFENFENEKYLLNLTNNSKITYKGKLIEVLKEFVVSCDDDEIILKEYKSKK